MPWMTCCPGRSAGCAFPAITSCTGRSLRGQDPAEPLLVAEQQVRALVGREATRESDGERVGVEDAAQLAQRPRRLAVTGELTCQAGLEEGDHLALLLPMGAPQLTVVDLPQVGERLGSVEIDPHRHPGGRLDEPAHRPAQPGRDVDAVGDGLDRVPGEALPGFRRGAGVELRYGVCGARVAQNEGGHVERRVRRVGVTAAELHDLGGVAAGVPEPAAQGRLDHVALEDLVAGRNGRVNGEDRVGPDATERLGPRQPGLRGDELPRPLEQKERGVALVEVPHRRRDVERPQRPHATDPEHQLLVQAHLAPADVEDVRDRPVRPVVGGDVGVEQEDGHPSDLGHPNGGVNLPVEDLDGDLQRSPAAASGASQRQLSRVEIWLRVLLVAIGVDLLSEVPAAVEEPDADERKPGVRRGLAVVAGEDAEAAGVELHRLVDAVLGTEVGDRARAAPVPASCRTTSSRRCRGSAGTRRRRGWRRP